MARTLPVGSGEPQIAAGGPSRRLGAAQQGVRVIMDDDLSPGSNPPWAAFRSPVAAGCQDGGVEVLSSRILLRPADLAKAPFLPDVLRLGDLPGVRAAG